MILMLVSMILILHPVVPASTFDDPYAILAEPLEAGQAQIIYLFHSGWLVRTRSHVLIFDYAPPRLPPGADPGEDPWRIDPEKLKGFNVVVFTSHGHHDHYDPIILTWREIIPQITYVFGWPNHMEDEHILCCDFERQVFDVDGITVRTVVRDWDGIPESAFLISIDGLTLYHAGDHSTPRGREIFKDNLGYLNSLELTVDFAFTPTWGGEELMIEALRPRYTFPMHSGGTEQQYARFKEKAERLDYPTKVIAARRRGDIFLFESGKVLPHGEPGK